MSLVHAGTDGAHQPKEEGKPILVLISLTNETKEMTKRAKGTRLEFLRRALEGFFVIEFHTRLLSCSFVHVIIVSC